MNMYVLERSVVFFYVQLDCDIHYSGIEGRYVINDSSRLELDLVFLGYQQVCSSKTAKWVTVAMWKKCP